MHQLIEKMIMPAFNRPLLEARHDGAVFDWSARGWLSPRIPTW